MLNRATEWWGVIGPSFTDTQWVQNFRMSEETYIYLCNKLRPAMERQDTIFRSIDNSSQTAMAETVFGIFVIRHEGAEPGDDPENVGIILGGVEVPDELRKPSEIR
ncbi:hypothetical protein NQZ68_032190 [Dissostichus eleginoides]|nr:hypothetical protein NQZ68_032190 [Dissostichus eleginoides]